MLNQGASVSGWLHQALLTGFSHIQEDSSTMRNGGAITFATANIASVIDVLKKVSPFGFFFSPTSRHSDSFASELNAGDEFHGRADARIPLGRLRGPQLPHSTPWLLVPAPLTRVIASRQGRASSTWASTRAVPTASTALSQNQSTAIASSAVWTPSRRASGPRQR